ncbi:HmuY family protein [Flexithrix dorotheae]|uniref:HmuY family protein n=1 Tax=Flexithrix dorotheae TaxID=70993 RepID=UPI00036F4B3D|nr:HmuY family protein [Flexithrix dorotheae]
MKNKFYQIYMFSLLSIFAFSSCDDSDEPEIVELEVQTAEDIPANPDGANGAPPSYTFYDLDEGIILAKSDSNSTKWDLAFSKTTILTNSGVSGPGNGGAMIVEGIFEDIKTVPETGFNTDTEESLAIPTGSENGWYTYTGPTGSPAHAILPIPGKVIMVKTGDGKYAKVEILSIYEGNPDTSTSEFEDLATRATYGYYTFRYVVQTEANTSF